jgi:protein-tyrosine-phosphatase
MTDNKPTVLFLCTHNAGRSQMALGVLQPPGRRSSRRVVGRFEPGDQINPAAVAAMAEVGIDITNEFPKPWTDEIVQASDVIITMGCGDTLSHLPGHRYEEWLLADPAGQPVEAVRPIRDEIEQRVRVIGPTPAFEPKAEISIGWTRPPAPTDPLSVR